jgi:cytochrome c oxidase subunit 4
MRIGRLVLTWVALLVLLTLTIASSFLPIGEWRQLINLAIAAAKAALILWIFMKMREETALVRLAAITSAVLLLVLGGMLAADYELRSPSPYVLTDGSSVASRFP